MKLGDPENMEYNDRIELLRTIQRILWMDFETGYIDPNKEWSSDTIDLVAAAMRDEGLGPDDG